MLRKKSYYRLAEEKLLETQMRKMVKRLLKKIKYPPEDYDFAINTVISR